tara:strand:- start:24580 stop:25473 length:894 start_codon:yes stop_codon:yes gene_type:complete
MSRKNPEYPFAPNQLVQPSIIQDGVVLFQDNLGNPQFSTQSSCNAYGYIWDEANQVCRAFIENPNINEIGLNTTNNVKGNNNNLRSGVNNTTVSGQNNLLLGDNISNVILGNMNQVENKVSNSLLLGTFGNSTVNNSLVIGGNNSQVAINEKTGLAEYSDIVGERQLTKILFGNSFQDEAAGLLNLNNVPTKYYPIPINSIIMFEADVLAVVIGGKTNGEFMSFKIQGVTRLRSTGEGAQTIYSTTTILFDSGRLGLNCQAVFNADNTMTIAVSNGKGFGVDWVASMELTQLQTKGI